MRSTRQASFMMTFALFLGAIWIYRNSPWMEKSPMSHAVAGASLGRNDGLQLPADAQIVSRLNDMKVQAKQREGVLMLCDPQVAERARVSEAVRSSVAKIVANLDARTEQLVLEVSTDWRVRGGFHNGRMPDFLTAPGLLRTRIEALKADAETRVFKLLTAEQQRRWQEIRVVRMQEVGPSIKIRPIAD